MIYVLVVHRAVEHCEVIVNVIGIERGRAWSYRQN